MRDLHDVDTLASSSLKSPLEMLIAESVEIQRVSLLCPNDQGRSGPLIGLY